MYFRTNVVGTLGGAAALAEFRTLQAEYEAWRDQLPESLADSRTAELLEGVCDVVSPPPRPDNRACIAAPVRFP